ncbi:DUF2179 domain-containing protein [Clostridium formicaceticum]|uniref:UPF0316 protein BJL90_07900 n=1 Tax=Clostridium formicaceticum TaxID=1497 RepID=A0AAC9RIJ7_9CLOT|nr:DUF2179 domain-containing protein [Clostridium formicaceticum]AOY75831.1 hypothetical protein BJL90_07900 [Clostridium formicaceticum]ARE86162.1 hypothetical protein CLFO_04780 [Clostridium formicaceticum]
MEGILGYLFIYFAKVSDVTLATIRMIMVVKGRRIQAALIGFVEITIYIMAIGKVLTELDNPVNVIAYALGFATGNYMGIFVEEKMALGSIIVQVISLGNSMHLVEKLREEGFGVTVVEGYGREGMQHLLNIMMQRKNLSKLYRIVDEHDRKAFVTITDARAIRGGYFTRFKRR